MKVEVWKCPYTGTLFEDEAKYKKHVWHAARRTAMLKRKDKLLRPIEEKLAHLRETALTASELVDFFMLNGNAMLTRAYVCSAYKWSDDTRIPDWYKKAQVLDCRFEINPTVKWEENSSWYHRAPLNGEMNKTRNPLDPLAWAYYYGRLHMIVNSDFLGSGTDLFEGTGINIGSGGGGRYVDATALHAGYRFDYDFKLFLCDWPAMAGEETQKALYGLIR